MHNPTKKAAGSPTSNDLSTEDAVYTQPSNRPPGEANNMPAPNNHYAAAQIRREGIQLYERALFDNENDNDNDNDNDNFTPALTSLESITRQYGGDHSSSPDSTAGPGNLERFSFVSSINDPHPMLARRALAEMNVAEGSLESLAVRASIAQALAAGVPVEGRSDSVEAVRADAAPTERVEEDELERQLVPSDNEGDDADLMFQPSAAGLDRALQGAFGGQTRVQRIQRMRKGDGKVEKRQRRR